jgi:hypothetical protein
MTWETETIRVADEPVLRIICPNLGCQRILAVPARARGKLVKCRTCGITVRIPTKDKKDDKEGAPQEGSAA